MFDKMIQDMSKEELQAELEKLRQNRRANYTQAPKKRGGKRKKSPLDDLPDDIINELLAQFTNKEDEP